MAIGVRIPCTPNKVSEFGEAGQRFSKLRALEARDGCVRTGMQVPSLEFLSLGVRLRDCLPTVPSVAGPGPLCGPALKAMWKAAGVLSRQQILNTMSEKAKVKGRRKDEQFKIGEQN